MLKLNDVQLKQVAESTANFGLVFFATVVTPVFADVDKVNPIMIALGLVLTIVFTLASLIILRGVKNES